jgi:hypothetical protein
LFRLGEEPEPDERGGVDAGKALAEATDLTVQRTWRRLNAGLVNKKRSAAIASYAANLLEACGGDRKKAARRLGIRQGALDKWLR